MSTDSQTATAPRHLTKHKREPHAARSDLKSREYYCGECSATVTVSPDGEREYGHERGCEHSIRGGGA